MEKGLLQQVLKWGIVNVTGFLIILGVLELSGILIGSETHDNIATSISIRVPLIIMGISLLLGGIMALEFTTPHNYLTKIAENPIACSILMSAYVVALAMVIAYV